MDDFQAPPLPVQAPQPVVPMRTDDGRGDTPAVDVTLTASLEDLQTDEQRRVLDTVSQVRKCGLESILSLPQLVVCGDQSAGKSSVLEALTEIPFPRNDNLCTRFATEIILRRAASNSLTIKVIPDSSRPTSEQAAIKAFKESIINLDELPTVMGKATDLLGLNSLSTSNLKPRAFAKDVLSIEIEGPSRPQLTLVDLPGLIQSETKGVTKADVDLVSDLTDEYISRSRTISLAVVTATNDYANQKILGKVRQFDEKGERTLGIITKPDRLPSGSGSEKAFVGLARNEDVFFHLGWHVLKNRSFEEGDSSLEERNAAEATYFRKSNFSCLAQDSVGIDSLRKRLSILLFEHVKRELPKLRKDLEEALVDTRTQLDSLGDRRTTAQDCKTYLTQLSLSHYEVCKAAVDGHYEGSYFVSDADETFSLTSEATICRLRAVVQFMNAQFSDTMRRQGHKYHIVPVKTLTAVDTTWSDEIPDPECLSPIHMTKSNALEWVSRVLTRTRGRELVGNFNPLLVGELFWEQSSKWHGLAEEHVVEVAEICRRFLDRLLQEKCPKDVHSRLWSSQIEEVLEARNAAAFRELETIMEEVKSYPINYNHYYTDTIHKSRRGRQRAELAKSVKDATRKDLLKGCNSGEHHTTSVDIDQIVESFSNNIDPNMDNVSCEEALECLFAIYKVSRRFLTPSTVPLSLIFA